MPTWETQKKSVKSHIGVLRMPTEAPQGGCSPSHCWRLSEFKQSNGAIFVASES